MLLLRKEAEEILAKEKMSMFHIERSSDGFLSLVGECGKTISTITNLRISTKLKDQERLYALELIQKFIDKHRKLLKEMIAEKKKLDSMVEPKIPAGYYKEYWNGKASLTKEKVTRNIKIGLNIDGERIIGISSMEISTFDKINIKDYEDGYKYLEELFEYENQKAKTYNLINKIQSCKI